MNLTEAIRSSRLAGAERSLGGISVLIHQSCQGYHLTRCAQVARAAPGQSSGCSPPLLAR